MLSSIRDGLKYWKWVLILIGVSFILFFGTDWWSPAGGGGYSANAGTVNGVAVDVNEWSRAARNLEARYRQQFGPSWDQLRDRINVRQQAWDAMVQRQLIFQDAKRLGLQVTDAEVLSAVKNSPRFLGVDGKYDPALYSAMRQTERAQILEDTRQDLLTTKWVSIMEAAAVVSPAEVEAEFARRNEKVALQYVALPLEDFDGQQPNETELQAWYDARRDQYSQGEGRRAVYALLDQTSVADKVEVTDQDIEAYYQNNLEQYRLPEQRRSRHILIEVGTEASADDVQAASALAREVFDKVKAGEDFAALASQYSQDPGSKDNGGDLGFYSRGQLQPEFDERLFSLGQGEVSEPVRTQYGYHVIRLEEIQEGQLRSLDEVRDEALSTVRFQKMGPYTKQLAQELADKAATNGLSAAATELGLELQDTGVVPRGGTIPGLGFVAEVVDEMFSQDAGGTSGVISIPRGEVVVSVQDVIDDYVPPLATIRNQIVAEFQNDQAGKLALEKLQKALDGNESDLNRVARRASTDVHETDEAVTRGSTLEVIGYDASIEEAVFAAQAGDLVGPMQSRNGVIVARVTDRQAADMSQLDAQRTFIQAQLRGPMANSLINERLTSMRESADERPNPAILEDPS